MLIKKGSCNEVSYVLSIRPRSRAEYVSHYSFRHTRNWKMRVAITLDYDVIAFQVPLKPAACRRMRNMQPSVLGAGRMLALGSTIFYSDFGSS